MKTLQDLNNLRLDYSDNDGALDVINLLQAGKSVFLTGKAGTGKSYLLNQIRSQIDNAVTLAPTGIAAINVKGQTIHSFFKLPIRPFLPADNDIERLTGDNAKIVKSALLIIIDEISMVRVDIMSAIDKTLQLTMSNPQPFGGKQLLVVGDLYQLPPVVTNNEKDIIERNYNSPFFFDAQNLQSVLQVVELTKVYRQSDPMFIRMLDTLRENKIAPNQLSWINERAVKKPSKNCITIATTNKIATNINATQLANLNTRLHSFDAEIHGDFESRGTMPAEPHLDVKVGAQVMMTNNAKDEFGNQLWNNGTLGVINEITSEMFVIELSGVKHQVERNTWESFEYKWDEIEQRITQQVTGSFTQFPIKLAWAVTIHKSQGLTFDKVNIDLGKGAFSAGQTYVAMSRCRTFEGITLKQAIKSSDIFVDDSVKRYMKMVTS